MSLSDILVGTLNAGKVREFRSALQGIPARLHTMDEFPNATMPAEEGETYRENARKKAIGLASSVGMAVVSDDSGLEVDALGGAPGVRSARYAGDGAEDRDRIAKLLQELKGRGAERSPARFVCAIALAGPTGVIVEVEAECRGEVSPPPRGDGGFGYDSIFVPEGFGETFGELPEEVKARVSHRGRALRLLRSRIAALPAS